jgi:manganese/iron transport system ATP-binding protein/manganese/zinc/iron transport system ATP- binding protein
MAMPTHVLEIKDVTVAYRRVPAVHHLDLSLHCGHCIALLGPNGAGKTSLFKALVGLVPLETGSVDFGGHGPGAATDIAYLPQRGVIDWDFPITVRGMVEMGRYLRTSWWRPFRQADAEAVDAALAAMDLARLGDRQISALSGGQQQRAFLARSLAQNAHVFLLDEPFTGLDKPAQELLRATIHQLAADGNLVIASHHDLKTVPDLFDQVIFLNGELIAFGETADVFTEENIARTFSTQVFSGTASHAEALHA